MQQIHISNLGSGYEMIFALLYSFYLSQQSGKQLILLMMNLSYIYTRCCKKNLFNSLESQGSSSVLSTHSPLLVKQLSFNDRVSVGFGQKMDYANGGRKLSYISSNETNYLAFNLASEEYHNEL